MSVQAGFLCKIASALPNTENNQIPTLLKSYYLTRCKEITRGHGLPDKHFSFAARCPHCCLEWRRNEIRLIPIKLSKRQRRRIKSRNQTKKTMDNLKNNKTLLHSNELEQICSFCNHGTKTPLLKPEKEVIKEDLKNKKEDNKKNTKKEVKRSKIKNNTEVNVYTNTRDVFCLKNENNILGVPKIIPKVTKNNKKKKDKFAGLCQKAVLASAKLKEEKEKQNKLNLFLKPSS